MGVVKFKQLKPKALKDKDMRLELLNGLRSIARKVTKDYEATTATWTNKPKFETVVSLRGGEAAMLVDTNDKIYGYVDQGTRPHIIRPVKAKRLAFAAGGSPKTQPGVIGSGAGSKGGTPVFAMAVNHPGTKAREFSKIIAAKWKKQFSAEMIDSMRRARAKSGHAI